MEIKIKTHYTFYIFLFFIVYFGNFLLFISYFIALFIHEISHYFVSKRYGVLSQDINIYPFGMNVCVNSLSINKNTNFLIFLIGPLMNILLLFATVSFWWVCPVAYFYTKNFAISNFILGFFNLLPIYPLDGGNMILQLIKPTNIKIKTLKIMKICCVLFGCFFMLLFIISCFYVANFSCFSVSFFLFASVFSYNAFVDNLVKDKLTKKNVLEQKAFVIKLDTKYDEIKKCFDDNKYVQFYVMNNENKIVKILNQDEIKNLFKPK